MPKHTRAEGSGLAARLATLRRAAGLTQQQLADELGISRRRMAYYEVDRDHPLTNLLPRLAHALNTTVDDLLNAGVRGRKGRLKPSPRLERQLRQIDRLSPKARQRLLSIIDSFLATGQTRPDHRRPGRSRYALKKAGRQRPVRPA